MLRARFPQAELVGICSDPAFVTRVYGIRAVPLWDKGPQSAAERLANRALLGMPGRLGNLSHAFQSVRGLDALLVPGTGILDDFGQRPSRLPYQLWRWCSAARLAGARVAFVSVGAGPIVHPLSRFLMKGAAASAHYRSYRDRPSAAFAKRIGLRAPDDRLFPDLAFALPAPTANPTPDGAPVIAVGVMAYFGWHGSPERGRAAHEQYLEKLADYIGWLVRGGRRVRLVIGDEKDLDTIARLRPRIAQYAAGIESFEPAQNLNDVMRQMNGVAVAVATRFHNLVCALRVGVPTMSLSYAAKNDALLDDFGLSRFHQNIEDFDLARLKRDTEQMLAQRHALATTVAMRVSELQALLREQDELLAQRILVTRA